MGCHRAIVQSNKITIYSLRERGRKSSCEKLHDDFEVAFLPFGHASMLRVQSNASHNSQHRIVQWSHGMQCPLNGRECAWSTWFACVYLRDKSSAKAFRQPLLSLFAKGVQQILDITGTQWLINKLKHELVQHSRGESMRVKNSSFSVPRLVTGRDSLLNNNQWIHDILQANRVSSSEL